MPRAAYLLPTVYETEPALIIVIRVDLSFLNVSKRSVVSKVVVDRRIKSFFPYFFIINIARIGESVNGIGVHFKIISLL